jgi:hypothetical protein
VATLLLASAANFKLEANFRSLGDFSRPASAQILMVPKRPSFGRNSLKLFGQVVSRN